jgi:hypothetical protein
MPDSHDRTEKSDAANAQEKMRAALAGLDASSISMSFRAKFTKMSLDYAVGFRCECLQIGIGA